MKSCFTSSISLLLLFLLSACATTVKIPIQQYSNFSSCHQDATIDYKKAFPQALYEIKLDTVLTNRFSYSGLNIANAFGFLELLKKSVLVEKKYAQSPTLENRLQKLEMNVRIDECINQASLEISAFASELDCEEERIAQVADYLKAKELERESKLTAAAIVVGAVGGVTSGILACISGSGNSGNYVGILTGVAETVLGTLIFNNNNKTAFSHRRNALKDIWYNPKTSTVFPPSIWYCLTYKNPNEKEIALREKIIERWKSFEQVNVNDPKAAQKFTTTFLGEKGMYSTEDLYNRAKMYDLIESYVKIIKQDLTKLSKEQLEK
jgi:hypothetical protein